ncbi:hypothetical protein HDA40_004620 [Hamadaea flava]|uniref:Male-enhanced antigen 1 n=1 Tax=Hamadaea flava TaxID=1742688 RepID=A0ABV8LGN6_9ACTN|nr:hypothetical protein [Hamadaea flava]MCP2326113.1 hypothetical protein [Hamadaea flava]
MTISQENAGAAPTPERLMGQLPGFQLSPAGLPASQMNGTEQPTPTPSRWAANDMPEVDDARPLDSGAPIGLGLDEPVYPPPAWLEETGLADHPLLRGLLMELPPKGAAPSPEWLNRWFEAARAILELLYVRA